MNAQPHFYRLGDYELDVDRRILRSLTGARPAATLTPRVFDTLMCLLEHAGELVEKETLINTVWPRVVVEENNLDQTISTLRQLLGERRGENRYIVTVRGRGYRLAAPVSRADHSAIVEQPSTTRADEAPSSSGSLRRLRSWAATRTGNRWFAAALATALLAAIVSVLALRLPGVPEAGTLAVLPFKPLVATDRNESLELGMAETLIMGLNATELRVSPLSSVRRYAGLDQDAVAAGRSLDVRAVLEGYLQRDGERLRVSARLLDVADGRQLWAERYDEPFTDIFSVQDAIAARVRAALTAGPLADTAASLQRHTRDVEAYQLYVTGRFHFYRLSEAHLREAIAYYERAIGVDPSFALAYVALADAYALLGVLGAVAPHETFPQAQRAVEEALALNADLGEAYASLGHIKIQYDHDWRGGEAALRRAIELNPRYAFAHQVLGIYLASRGRFDEGIESMRRAQTLEPLAPGLSALIGMLLSYERRYEAAITQLQQTLAMDPTLNTAHAYIAAAYLRSGQHDEAMEHLRRLESPAPGSAGYLGQLHVVSGRDEQARREAERLIALSGERYVAAYDIATIYGALGDADAAFLWIERAFDERSTLIAWLPWDPAFDGIRSDARYAALVRRLSPE